MAGLSKLGGKLGESKMADAMKGKEKPMPEGKVEGEKGDSQTVITHHADGSHSVDGEKHPSHMHMLAAVGHKVTGGDKHHIVHHDGMSASSHSIHEDGTHEEHGEHNSADEAKGALDKFLGEEAQEPEHQQQPEEESAPAYGAM